METCVWIIFALFLISLLGKQQKKIEKLTGNDFRRNVPVYLKFGVLAKPKGTQIAALFCHSCKESSFGFWLPNWDAIDCRYCKAKGEVMPIVDPEIKENLFYTEN